MVTTLLIIIITLATYFWSESIYTAIGIFLLLSFFRKFVNNHTNNDIDKRFFVYQQYSIRSFIKKYISEEKIEYVLTDEHKIFDKILEDIFYDFLSRQNISIITLEYYLNKRNKYVFLEFISNAEYIFEKLFNKLPEEKVTLYALDRFFNKHVYV